MHSEDVPFCTILDLLYSIGELCFMIHNYRSSDDLDGLVHPYYRWHTHGHGTLNVAIDHLHSFTYNFKKHWLTYVLPMIYLWFSTYPPGQLTFCQARCSFSSAGCASWCLGISHSHACCNYCYPVTSQGDLKIISLYTYIHHVVYIYIYHKYIFIYLYLYTSCVYIYIHHLFQPVSSISVDTVRRRCPQCSEHFLM